MYNPFRFHTGRESIGREVHSGRASLEGDHQGKPGVLWVSPDDGFQQVSQYLVKGWLVYLLRLVITVGQWLESVAGVIHW